MDNDAGNLQKRLKRLQIELGRDLTKDEAAYFAKEEGQPEGLIKETLGATFYHPDECQLCYTRTIVVPLIADPSLEEKVCPKCGYVLGNYDREAEEKYEDILREALAGSSKL